MSQFIWEGLFSILNVLIPGVVLALFAVYYQNKRKREIQVEGKLAIERIDGYENVLCCLYEGQNLHEVSLKEENDARAILSYFDLQTYNFECPAALQDEVSFDTFYEKLTGLQKTHEIYLDDKTARKLNHSIYVYSNIKMWMDAFSDTEHAADLKVKKEVARKHIDWMYKLMGMMMFSHCTRAYAQFDMAVCEQMQRFSLTYRKRRLRSWLRNRFESVMHTITINSSRQDILGRMCKGLSWLYIGKNGRSLSHIMLAVVPIMGYVHFSDSYTPEEYFERKRMPDEKEMSLFGEVLKAMIHKL